jgi:hypothetical protein
MIDADYEMKKASLGLVHISNVSSVIDRLAGSAAKGGGAVASGGMMSRFWFHLEEGAPSFVRGEGIVAIDRCRMVVLTERQLADAEGELRDAGGTNPHAEAFAREFSDHLDRPGVRIEKIYADLDNLFRLRALVLALEHDGAMEVIGSSNATFLPHYAYRDESPMKGDLPPLGNHKEVKIDGGRVMVIPFAFGGVGMDMAVGDDDFHMKSADQMSALRAEIRTTRPLKSSIVWRM